MMFLQFPVFEVCNRKPLLSYNIMSEHGSTKYEIRFIKPPTGACPCLRKCAGDKNEAWQVLVSLTVEEEATPYCDLCNETFLDY